MAYTIWSKPYHSSTWVFCGLQLDSEKLAEQTFTMYRLAPGETIRSATRTGSSWMRGVTTHVRIPPRPHSWSPRFSRVSTVRTPPSAPDKSHGS